jgi:hypothetical protein
MANSMSKHLPNAMELAVTLTLQEMKDTDARIILTTIIFFAVTVCLIVFTGIFLIRPTILYTQNRKNDVLKFFLSIEPSHRRHYRRAATRIYQSVNKNHDKHHIFLNDDDDVIDNNTNNNNNMKMHVDTDGDESHDAVTSTGIGATIPSNTGRRSVSGNIIDDVADSRHVDGYKSASNRRYKYSSRYNVNNYGNTNTNTAASPIPVININSIPFNQAGFDGLNTTDGSIDDNSKTNSNNDIPSTSASASVSSLGPMMRPLLFLLAMVVYFIVHLSVAYATLNNHEQAAQIVYTSNLRAPQLATALTFATRNIVSSKAMIAATDPHSALLLGPEFWVGSSEALEQGLDAHFAVLFGGVNGINSPMNNGLQNQLLFKSICNFPIEKAYELMPSLRSQPQVFRDCDILDSGILHRGLYAAVQAFSDDVGPLTTAKYSLGFLDIILGFPAGSQLTFEEAVQAGVTYQTTNQVFSDYIMHLLELSSLIYLDYGRSFMMQYDNIRLTMIVIFSFIFVFFYIFAFQRLVSELSRTAAQTNAIMLLLPLQISTHNKHAQEYIARNLSRD